MVKLDIAKAFVRVEWPFLSTIMLRLGFSSQWVELVMRYVKFVSFSFLVNGVPQEHVIPNRGLRQDDPIFPVLFLFCSEGLSGLLCKAVERTTLQNL